MENMEEQGKALLSNIITMLIIHGVLSIFVEALIYKDTFETAVINAFSLSVYIILLLLMNKGYIWVKVINILILFVNVSWSIIFIFRNAVSTFESVWIVISIIVYTIALVYLLFSKRISWYMHFKRDY
ncbi:Ca2+/Na+ antiporter [Evansella vedderi]|uniref:Ca2+/Na+ antiporter n=1 Tax=Evansella vedderi TaxID=38282 RepID=A0ABT9ZYI7_9BACI|nr:hypothetical protein [Evansella vedderi]MDQ0256311.1 Ca2+/Na+ antiporter [Evansella vedderi]